MKTRRLEPAPLASLLEEAANVVGFRTIKALWPEATPDTYRAAPVEVVVRALINERHRYRDLAQRRDGERRNAERLVAEFMDAARGVLDAAPTTLDLGAA